MEGLDRYVQFKKEHKIAVIQSAIDPASLLIIRPNGGGDIAFETERFDLSEGGNSIMHMGHTSLRCRGGCGKYATLSKYYRTVDDLYEQFSTLKKETLRENLIFPIANDDYNFNDVTVEKITFLADDSGQEHQGNIYNADGVIGLESFKSDKPNYKATVWLGNMNGESDEAKLLSDLWQSAKEACEYYTTQSPRDGFAHIKTTFKELNL